MVVHEKRKTSLHSPTFERKRALGKSQETWLTSGREVFGTMLRLIDTAKYSIDLQYYSFEADETGRKVLDALQKAKEKNPSLRIRLLLDQSVEYLNNIGRVGSNTDAKALRDATNKRVMQMRDDGIFEEVAITNRFTLKGPLANALNVSNIAHREHKKLFLVDARDADLHPDAMPKAIVASANVNIHHEQHWKDAGRLFEGGQIVQVLQEDFEYTAKHAERWRRVYEADSPTEYFKRNTLGGLLKHPRRALSDLRGAIVRNAERKGQRIVTTPDPQGRKNRDEVVATDSFFGRTLGMRLVGFHAASNESFRVIKQAKRGEKVVVASPYPGFFILTRCLVRAAHRGVHVELVIPQNNNHVLYNHKKIDEFVFPDAIPHRLQSVVRRVAHWNLSRWENRLSQSGVDVYKYTGAKEGLDGMIHFKGMLLLRNDGTTRRLNGSANYTKGPISGSNREIIVATEGNTKDEPMLAFMESLKTDSIHIPPTRRR